MPYKAVGLDFHANPLRESVVRGPYGYVELKMMTELDEVLSQGIVCVLIDLAVMKLDEVPSQELRCVLTVALVKVLRWKYM